MSSVEAPARAGRPAAERATVSGWGCTKPVGVTLVRPGDRDQLAALLAGPGAADGAIARGAGRSYGDAAQNLGGVVIDTRLLSGIGPLDARSGEVRVGAGTRFTELLEQLARHGMTLPVVPGTAHLSVGGAIAADVHGKNHRRDGSFVTQVSSIELCTPAHGELEVSDHDDPELFAATFGGMGLTGVITAATLRTIVLRTPCQVADVNRVDALEDAVELLADAPHSHMIAWLDLMARGRCFGRGVVTRSYEGEQDAGPRRLGLRPAAPGLVARVPPALLRSAVVRAHNEARWRRAPRAAHGVPLPIGHALFPLDAVGEWNRLYGRRGLIQYQFAVPDGQEKALRGVLDLLRGARLPMYLATLKRFGPAGPGMLSFPLPGWTLAIDIPAGAPALDSALERADELVVEAGGRVYLAKDARMSPKRLAAMYPRLGRFLEVRARVDPHERLRSDLSRRLGLTR